MSKKPVRVATRTGFLLMGELQISDEKKRMDRVYPRIQVNGLSYVL